jgi:hypothetical protein
MKHLFIYIFVIFLSVTASVHSQCCANERLVQFIEREKSNISGYQKSEMIFFLFYKVEQNEYFLVYTAPFFRDWTFNGYCYYKDNIIIYEGSNDAIAKKLINLDSLIRTTESINSLKWNNEIYDPPNDHISYYQITAHNIEKIIPDEKHKKELLKELIRVGAVLLPPPPPIE